MSVLAFVIAATTSLAPGTEAGALSEAIAHVVESAPPLFSGDEDRRKTAALMVAVAFRESSFRVDVIGDHGQSHCAFQIHLPGGARTSEGWSGEDLRTDAERCASVGLRMLRESVRIDRQNPVAFYARGPAWQSETARKISRDRMAIAKRLAATIEP